MKYQTFLATLGPLAALATNVTAADSNNSTALLTTRSTTVPSSNATSTAQTISTTTPIKGNAAINNSTATPTNNDTVLSTTNGTAISISNSTAVPSNDGTAISTNSSTAGSHCNANCVHRLTFRSGYNGAKDGFGAVFSVCDAFDWCYNDAKEWCPDIINSRISRIASHVKSDVMAEIDYNNVNNSTLLSSVLSINARSTRMAISAAQHILKAGPTTCSADQVSDLERIRWLMAQQEGPIDYDANTFDAYFSEDNEGPLQKRDENVCSGDVVLCESLPWLRRFWNGARNLLSKFKSKLLRSAIEDPQRDIMESEPFSPEPLRPEPLTPEEMELKPIEEAAYDSFRRWWRGPDPAKGFDKPQSGPQRIEEWLDEVPDEFEEVPADMLENLHAPEPFYPPEVPADVAEGVPPEDIDPGWRPYDFSRHPYPLSQPEVPAEQAPDPLPIDPPPPHQMPRPLYQADIYDEALSVHRVFTVTPNTAKVPSAELKELGLEAFDELDSVGNIIKTRWLDPFYDLNPTPGEWESLVPVGGNAATWEYVRRNLNPTFGTVDPVLNSVGEPMIAAAEGTIWTLAPVVEDVASGLVNDGVDILGHLFSLFKPEGGLASTSKLEFDSESGSVRIHRPSDSEGHSSEDTGDQQDHDDGEEKKPAQPGKLDSEDHENAKQDEPEDSEDKEDKEDKSEDESNDVDDHQTAETTAHETTAHETTALEKTTFETTAPKATADETTFKTTAPKESTPTRTAQEMTTAKTTGADTTTPNPTASEKATTSNKKTTTSDEKTTPEKTTASEKTTKFKETTTSKKTSIKTTDKTTPHESATSETNDHKTTAPDTNAPGFDTATATHDTTTAQAEKSRTTKVHAPDTASPSSHLPTFPKSPLSTTKPTSTTKSIKSLHSTKSITSKLSKAKLSSDPYFFPDGHLATTSLTPNKTHSATEAVETKKQTSSNPYPYPNEHTSGKWPGEDLPMTFPAPTKALSTMTMTVTTTSTWKYPYPDNYHHARNFNPISDNNTPTTFSTLTKPDKVTPAIPTVTVCRNNDDCAVPHGHRLPHVTGVCEVYVEPKTGNKGVGQCHYVALQPI